MTFATAGEYIASLTLGGKYLIYVSGWMRHVSLHPVAAGDEAFERAIAPYRSAKTVGHDTVKFPLNRAVPYEMIERVVEPLLTQRAGEDR